MIRSIDGAKVMADTKEVLAHLDGRSNVKPGPVGTLGYCMGGGYALLAAGTFPDRVAAAASFHGGSLATDRPDSPHLLADRDPRAAACGRGRDRSHLRRAPSKPGWRMR